MKRLWWFVYWSVTGNVHPDHAARYRGGNDAILVDREGKATTPQQRRKVVLRGKGR